MNTSKLPLFFLGLLGIGVFLVAGCSYARADGVSLQIQNISPTGAISPGTTVSFYASASGFVDPTYSVADSFSASGSTVGAIDKFGYFTWTPGIYDAGMHAITVSVTDNYLHSASTTANILVASNTILVTNLSPGPIVAVRRPITFSITAPGFITPTYSVYDSYAVSTLNNSAINSSGTFSWTPTNEDLGAHTLSLRVSDIYGHTAQTTVNVTIINPMVSIQSLKPGSGAGVGSSVSFVASAPTLANPVYSVRDSFNGTSTVATSNINSAGLFTWTPSIADLGLHSLAVTATDVLGNAASSTTMISITTASATVETPVPIPTPLPVPMTSTTTASSPAITAVATKKYLFTANLAIGSRGTAVLELQKRLTALGFYTGPITGYYGSLTSASVKQFQGANSISRLGIVGPATRAALNK